MEKMSTVYRENVLKLMNERDTIMAEINKSRAILDSEGIGMDEPLVDPEGFPLNNVNVYEIRTARNAIICLLNDYKQLTTEIEQKLKPYFDAKNVEDSFGAKNLEPIAKVNLVTRNSPAEIDGIQLDDLIVEFGSLNSSNFHTLADFADVTKNHENKSILVKVLRKNHFKTIMLTPRRWLGNGLLGCNIIPLDTVER